MKTVCISSSFKYKNLVRETIQRFRELGIGALFPNLDLKLDKLDKKTVKRGLRAHFRAIDCSEALYVIDPKGYIGKFAKKEMDYALGKGKPIYFSEKTGSPDLDFVSEDIIPIDSIERFLKL